MTLADVILGAVNVLPASEDVRPLSADVIPGLTRDPRPAPAPSWIAGQARNDIRGRPAMSTAAS
jgi:hypothetical protein